MIAEVHTEKRQHIRIQLPVECAAVVLGARLGVLPTVLITDTRARG
jgi:hypothetical protein